MKNNSEENSSNQNSEEIIDRTCGDNGKKYSIHNKKRVSHLLILSMQLMTYLWIVMPILSIDIMHIFIVK